MANSGGELACKLGIAAIVGAVIATFVGAPTWSFNEKGAAWAQAIGAILALGVTILLNRADARERRVDRDARARNAGISVKPALVEFRDELRGTLEELDRGLSPANAGPYELADENFEESPFTHGIAGTVSPSKALAERVSAIAELGTAAKATQTAYRTMEDLGEAFRGHYVEQIGECLYDNDEQNAATIALMRRCVGEVDAAIHKIDLLYI